MDIKDEIKKACLDTLTELGLKEDSRYIKRLEYEIIEYDVQVRFDVLRVARQHNLYWDENENNLLVPYLLGVCPPCDIDSPPASIMGEYPDIDMDYISPVRDHLRNDWAPNFFGHDKVSYICTYQTYGIKQSVTDMARVFDLDRYEILAITKQFSVKDDEGDALTWDKAEELYPAFKKWCADHPEASQAAKHLTGRNRNMSQHAGGYIISSEPLEGFVPLVRNKKDESMMAAWTEGQNSQDLMGVGLVKFDLLGSKMQEQMVECINYIRLRYGIEHISSAGKGMPHWSDDSYLNDPECIANANKGDLRFIFQFDSDGIRRLVRMGGVDRFNDLEAYSALYRPGPMNTGMHEAYCNRKKGKEKYSIHPILEPYLRSTYGVMCYQEQVMQVLNVAGKIPLRDAYSVVKAISKKKIDKFIKYKDQFIANSQITLGLNEEEAIKMWQDVESFAEYGFNKSHSCVYTHQSSRQLYLRTHYPVEYFCSMLNHAKDDDKLRDCNRSASSHGVKVQKVDINKSNVNFSIHTVGDKPSKNDIIYFGLSNVKFLGEEAAKRIVTERTKNGPYTGFVNFLQRFGTDSHALKSLISLGTFNDASPTLLWRYCEYYKGKLKREADRQKRYIVSIERYKEQFKELVGDIELTEDNVDIAMASCDDPELSKKIRKLRGNYKRTLTNYEKNSQGVNDFIPFEEFDMNQKYDIKPELEEILTNKEKAEVTYYGFCWNNPLDACDNIEGYTLDKFKAENYGIKDSGPIEGLIQENREVTSKKGSKYRLLKILDANWEFGLINVWADDAERFKKKLKVGNVVRLTVHPPDPQFRGSRYALKSYPRYMQQKMPEIDRDPRVVVLHQVIDDVDLVLEDDDQLTINMFSKSPFSFNLKDDNEYDTDQQINDYFAGQF